MVKDSIIVLAPVVLTLIKEYCESMGYMAVKQMKNGKWIGLSMMNFTVGLCIDLREFEYSHRYCYQHLVHAMVALAEYEGEGDPIGPWIKRKGLGGEKLGPGAKGE
jgi:hypothetical protein